MPSKDEIIDELKKYNTELLSKLGNASEWMKKSIEEKQEQIEKRRGNYSTQRNEEAILQDIEVFFSEVDFFGKKADIFDDIFSSEILYEHMLHNDQFDGTAVIIGYNKAVDITIEERIIKPFRKYAHKHSENFLKSGRLEERLLYQVIYDGYTLSLGRLFSYTTLIQEENVGFFTKIFRDFLEEYFYVKELLEDTHFLNKIESIINKDYFGSKRHSGSVSLTEVQEVRNIVMGNFKNKDCILYQLLKM